MPQAIVDPQELRRFALMLKKFNNEMGEKMSALANQLNDLTNSWRDQEQTKFRIEFEQHMKMIARFIEAKFKIPALTARDANADALMDLFDFTDAPAFLTPPSIPAPAVNDAGLQVCVQQFGQ